MSKNNIKSLPKKSRKIIQFLKNNNEVSPLSIKEQFPDMLKKDFKYLMRRLREVGIVVSVPYLQGDMRRVTYRIANPEECRNILQTNLSDELKTEIMELIKNA